MKKWKFSLQTVQDLKTRIEEQAAQKHAAALVRVSRAKAELAETEKELNAVALMQFSRGPQASGQELLQLNRYMELLEKQRRQRLEKCLHAEKEATLARAALEKAAREREVLDKLREHRHANHKFHVAQQEQKWIDEIAQQLKRRALATV